MIWLPIFNRICYAPCYSMKSMINEKIEKRFPGQKKKLALKNSIRIDSMKGKYLDSIFDLT